MRPIVVSCVIDAPRERIFDYLSDVANYPEFTDHFMKDYRLERLESRGVGAAATFRIESSLAHIPLIKPLASLWVELVITEADPPHRLVLAGHGGRLGRARVHAQMSLTRHDEEMTRLELRFSSDPANAGDRLRELVGARAWLRFQWSKALRRLRSVIEEGTPSAHAVRVAPG